ncbi:ComEC/Rec2 family competence protein [Clostridium gelidum]|nr:MBL fold metallo-hydrolase [Clostridium gelidum]
MQNSKLNIEFLNVGHGDCSIIKWNTGTEKKSWICVIDAGKEKKQIEKYLLDKKIYEIDLAITSHFDLDHIGGFINLDNKIKIKEYWSPYTPAFKKNTWLFGKRIQESIQRAEDLEAELKSKGTILFSPVEDFIYSPVQGLRIRVLSPAYKIYEELLSNKDKRFLIENYPTPLNWLIENSEEYNDEDNINISLRGLYDRTNHYLIKRNLSKENDELSVNIEKEDPESTEIIDGWSKKFKIEPEFFGNPLLNDTSIVLKVEAWIGSRWVSILFPGDIQNWLYLMAKRPNDLVSDIYKAAHHGSYMYIEKEIKYDEVIQSIRPKLTIFSANGQYGLPRMKVRDAITRWSTAVACTQQKKCDFISLNESTSRNDCCQKNYLCSMDSKGVSVEIKRNGMKINPPPCIRSAYSSPIPIIQLEQHIVNDSKILTYLSEREIDKHLKWLKKKLDTIHNNRKKGSKPYCSPFLSLDDIRRLALNDSRYLTEKQIKQIFEYGYSKGEMLTYDSHDRRNIGWENVYRKPKKSEFSEIINDICQKDILISSIIRKNITSDSSTFMLNLERDFLAEYLEKETGYPSKLISDYVWNLFIEKIISNFNIFYLPSNKNEPKDTMFVLLINRKINFEEYIKNINETIKSNKPKCSNIDRCEYLFDNYILNSKWHILSLDGLSENKWDHKSFLELLVIGEKNVSSSSVKIVSFMNLKLWKVIESNNNYYYKSPFIHLFNKIIE